jgi:ParB-like chromosome segregation protein Spo0J
MSTGDGYALDIVTPVRHVATALDGAAPAALSVADLAATYTHPIPADLTRVKLHEGRATDAEAVEFLIERALAALKHRGKSSRAKPQINSDSSGGYSLAVPFDALEYEGEKLVRLVKADARDEERAWRAVYNDMREDRSFYVSVAGARGGVQERQYRLHPLARVIPKIPEKEFFELVADIKRHGVKVPLVTFDGSVLDGRHRLAAAAALKLPVRISEFTGTEDQARDHVISLNVKRRHLTIAQRGLIVIELYLPEAEAKADKRLEEGRKKGGKAHFQDHDALDSNESRASQATKAIEEAAQASQGLATVGTLARMAPVRNAPKTQERIRSGEIKSGSAARREALKETGSNEPEKPAAVRQETAYRLLGRALDKVRGACEALERGDIGKGGGTAPGDIVDRINEIRTYLDRAEQLTSRP